MKTHYGHSTKLPFEVTRELLTTCEDVLLASSKLPATKMGKTIRWLREVLDSFLLNIHGASLMGTSVGITIMMSIAIPLVTFGLLRSTGLISPKQAQDYTYAGLLLVIIAIAFSKPSRYALIGYSPRNVRGVMDRLPDLRSSSAETLSAMQDCLRRAEKETEARLNTIKWTAGSGLAVAIYLAQKGFDMQNGEMLSYAVLTLFYAAFIAAFIAFHARGATAVYGVAYAVVHCLQIEMEVTKTSPVRRTRWLGPRGGMRRSEL
jgi:hypothetical protein